MNKIINLILKVGFIKTDEIYDEFNIYTYKNYKIFFCKNTETFSLKDTRNNEDLIFFDIDLKDGIMLSYITEYLNQEFKYELRKEKLKNILKIFCN